MNKEKFYITTPIYYPSGKFHIGTAYCEILTDCIKRYKEFRGFDTFMLTGLDEHGLKIQKIAEEKHISPKEHVDEMASKALELWRLMDIKYDKFIRTTDEEHIECVKKIVNKFIENDDIYKGKYTGLYCLPCENYFTESQLNDGLCPDCGRKVEVMEEEAYFFNIKKYENWLKEFYEQNPNFIVPESRKKELFTNFINNGLEDLCISRCTFDWGIKMPNDPKHVLYVWLDALTNYITALGYMSDDESLFNKYWPADLHVVGKEITRFHGIYWPIFLHALGLELPKQILAHSWIIMKDGKMSKSMGNVIYPEFLIDNYGLDAVKYYLLRMMNFNQDSQFTPEDFVERYNSDLANTLGNLLNRTVSMVNKYFDGTLPTDIIERNEQTKELNDVKIETINNYITNMDTYHISNAINEVWKLLSRANKYIDETEPWVLYKEEKQELLKDVMYNLIDSLRLASIMIRPIMPNISKKIFEQLGLNETERVYENLVINNIEEGVEVTTNPTPLFIRLDKEIEINKIQEEMSK